MKETLIIIQIVISICLSLLIIMQNRGTGLSSTFGGSGGGNFYSSKRGVEKILSRLTVVFAILFIANAVLYMYLVG